MPTRLAAALALACLAALAPAAGVAQQTPFQPVATVNDSAITAFDLEQRVRILSVLGAPAEDPERLRRIALDRLIQDRLRLQAGARAGITPTDEIVEAGLSEFAGRAGVTPETLLAELQGQGVTRQALEDLLAAQVIWREVVRQRFRQQVEPGEAEIDVEIARAAEGQGQGVAYRLREIGLPLAEGDRTPAETRALADRLFRELSAGGDFVNAVDRYSRAASRGRGGDVGWVRASELPPELVETLAALEIGEVARPMPVGEGLTIVQLMDRRAAGGGDLDAGDPDLREQVRRSIMSDRLQRLAEGYLQELRRDALIEIRR